MKPEFADYNAVYIFSHTSTYFILLKNVGLMIVKAVTLAKGTCLKDKILKNKKDTEYRVERLS